MPQTFDADGNILTRTNAAGTTTYTWDARNRLTALSGPTVSASFTYDAFGQRSAKTINRQTTSFAYDGLDVTLEDGPSGLASYLRTLGIDEALTRTEGAETLTYLTDALGSTVTLADATGATPTSYTYAPFGETAGTGTTANPVQFTGRENDGTGLYYYRARYYDPALGRFLSEDPIITRSVSNPFIFVGNNPLRFADPLGLWYVEVGGATTIPLVPGGVGLNLSLQISSDGVFLTGGFGAGLGTAVNATYFWEGTPREGWSTKIAAQAGAPLPLPLPPVPVGVKGVYTITESGEESVRVGVGLGLGVSVSATENQTVCIAMCRRPAQSACKSSR